MKVLKIVLTSLLILIFSACDGQKPNANMQPETSLDQTENQFTNKPKVDVKVNKKFDDKGQLIQFDSTYTYYYSSPKGMKHLGLDSIYNNFRSYFDNRYPNFMNRNNNSVFYNDSLLKYDFFNDDYFQKRFELNEELFDNFYQRMDSIKKEFMNQYYPNGFKKKKV